MGILRRENGGKNANFAQSMLKRAGFGLEIDEIQHPLAQVYLGPLW